MSILDDNTFEFDDLVTEDEVLTADIDRSFSALINKWETEPDTPIDDICDYLDNLIEVVEGKSTYNDFVEKSNMYETDQLWLN